MPIFQYKGYKADGTETSGTVEADGIKDAVSRIKGSGLFPKEVREFIQRESVLSGKRDLSLLPAITRQLSILLVSGVPLIEALKSLGEENRGFWKRVIADIRETVAGGASLSRAMAGHGNAFPEFYVNMVEAGEASGNLANVLSRLADFLEKQDSIKQKVRAAMIYPSFMVVIGFIVLSFLFVFVIPKIVRIFEDTKAGLPLITVILLKVSGFFRDYWWLIAGFFAGAVFGFRKFKEKKEKLIDGAILRVPGGIIQSLYNARFTRALGFLLEGGLPVLRALELASKTIGNKALEEKVSDAGIKVAEGGRLSSSLEGFSPVLLQLISTGEKSGRLVEILNRAADSYEDEFSRKVQKALNFLEPSMILIMGVIVGFIVFAILLPMFQLNQIVR